MIHPAYVILALGALAFLMIGYQVGVELGRKKGEEVGRLRLAVQLQELMATGHLVIHYEETEAAVEAVAEKVGDVFVLKPRVTH